MSINEILEIENGLNRKSFEVHLFLHGDWWRAYEGSAFICSHLGNVDELKGNKRIQSDKGEYVFVGLRLLSFSKYFSNIDLDNDIVRVDDKHIVFNVSKLCCNISVEELPLKFKEWKDGIPLEGKKKQKDEKKGKEKEVNDSNSVSVKRQKEDTLFGIAQDILAYQLNHKTPMECICFIEELKKKTQSLIF